MSRQDNIYNAKLAEQAERYDDMIGFMKSVITVGIKVIVRKTQNFPMKNGICSVLLIRIGLVAEELPGEPFLP